MRQALLNILKFILKYFARRTIFRYQPGIVAVTGSVGKTSTREAIRTVLSTERKVRASSGNFNNELGVPLTILGDWSKIEGIFFWPKVFFVSFYHLFKKIDYPEILILEYAADRPGDIRYLLEIAKPHIAVVTAVGETPVHVEFYSGPEAVAREKSRLIEHLSAVGFAVLNADEELVLEMRSKTRAQIMTFGFDEKAQVRIAGFENISDSDTDEPVGVVFKLEQGGSFVPVRLNKVFGRGQAYAAAAAACVGLIFGMNLVKIAEALTENLEAPAQRLNLISGVKGTYILDDSYNASPLSMKLALETLKELKAGRKVAVLGDMLEIGRYTIEEHEQIGKTAAEFVDLLFTVGLRAKFIAEAARRAGLPEKNIFSFSTADQAKKEVELKIKKGDLILIKASHSIRLDKIVEEIRDAVMDKS